MIRNVRLPKGCRGDKPSPEITAYAVEEAIQKQWQRLLNVAAYFCNQRDPSLSRKLEWITSELLTDGYQHLIDPETVARFDKYGVDLFAEIEAGLCSCIEWRLGTKDPRCGGARVEDIQYHHVRPKSQGGKDGPVVPLCAFHHEQVTQNAGGKTWRDWAVRWGFTDQGTIQPFKAPECDPS